MKMLQKILALYFSFWLRWAQDHPNLKGKDLANARAAAKVHMCCGVENRADYRRLRRTGRPSSGRAVQGRLSKKR
jgi:hypothetical protein